MSDTATTQAPESPEAPAIETYIGIENAGPRGQITLRADLSCAQVAAAVSNAAGLAVPEKLAVTHDGDSRAVWMSPDELLLILPAGQAPGAIAKLQAELADHHHMALDVSDARSIFRLTGPAVGEVLAKGAPCDVSDHGCPPGTARRTHLAGLAIGLWRLGPQDWEIVCFRSYAPHLLTWLQVSAAPGAQL